MSTISHHSALIYVMVVVAAADGTMSDKELRTIGELSHRLPAFRDFDQQRLLPIAQECAQILQEDDGFDAVLGLVRDGLPEQLRETAYWMALEVALTDARIALEEVAVIDALRRALQIDRLVAVALERGARARYQVA
ncbi:MAG TPA: tellurite resistance TerB family protein [Rhizomicrobium sp.]|jgi:tellurite resistance protein